MAGPYRTKTLRIFSTPIKKARPIKGTPDRVKIKPRETEERIPIRVPLSRMARTVRSNQLTAQFPAALDSVAANGLSRINS